MQQQNYPPNLMEAPSQGQPGYGFPPPLSKEEYYGGARLYQPSPFAPNIVSMVPIPSQNIGPSYVDSEKIKKKERNNSNSSERNQPSSLNKSSNSNLGSFPINNKKPPVIREGDWECPECKNINFAKRLECNRCRAARPVQSRKDRKPASHLGGPPGLFKEGDWLCPKCRNVNFQKRNKCNRCGEGKPNENETRTGKGGGHYDRQDPKDKKSYRESDDEYDDFGRKKKRKNKNMDKSQSRSKSNGRSKGDSRDNRRRYRSKSRSRERRSKERSRNRSRDRHKNRSRDRRSRS